MTNAAPTFELPGVLNDAEIQKYQRDFIDWLQGYRRTDTFIEILKCRHFTFAEIAAMRDRLTKHLVPKSNGERQTPGRRGRK